MNRSHFKTLENEWQDLLEQGNKVDVNIQPVYQDDTVRPHVIMGKYEVTDKEGKKEKHYFSFTNENLETEEFEIPCDEEE